MNKVKGLTTATRWLAYARAIARQDNTTSPAGITLNIDDAGRQAGEYP